MSRTINRPGVDQTPPEQCSFWRSCRNIEKNSLNDVVSAVVVAIFGIQFDVSRRGNLCCQSWELAVKVDATVVVVASASYPSCQAHASKAFVAGVVDSVSDVEMDTTLFSEDADDDAAVPFQFGF